jgi:hypothetical protein
MSETVQVTRSLLSAPLPQIIERLGMSIAQAQSALDENSVKIAKELVSTKAEIAGKEYSLLALGFTPTFYAFTEATVEAKLSFSMSETTELGVSVGASVSGGAGFIMVAASVDVSYSRKFSVSSEGSSSIAARIVSLPPPEQLTEILRAAADAAEE